MLGGTPKLAVCWIWGSPFVWTRSVETMLQLQRPAGMDVQFFRGRGWGPAKRHMDACERAVAWGADHILILGADQTYQQDLLLRLWERKLQGYEVVAALVPSRGYLDWVGMKPFQAMAWRIKGNGVNHLSWDRSILEAVDPSAGEMQRIDFIGSGVILFERAHLEMMKQPWFFEEIDHETQNRTACMDTRFCYRLASEADAQVWVDTTIKVKHINPQEVDETYSDRFADWAEPGVGPEDICQFTPPVAAQPQIGS